MNVAVIGASNKPERYSYQAVKLLAEKGHKVFPVHQRFKDIEGLTVYASLKEISEKLDTVTLYVSSDISDKLTEEILNAKPRRVIFNPGAENPHLEKLMMDRGIQTLNACTLVMLRTGQF